MLSIIKGCHRTTVDEQSFKRLYEPNGWRVDTEEKPKDKVQETIISLKNETEAKNYIAMTRKPRKQFNDKVFKSEATGGGNG